MFISTFCQQDQGRHRYVTKYAEYQHLYNVIYKVGVLSVFNIEQRDT